MGYCYMLLEFLPLLSPILMLTGLDVVTYVALQLGMQYFLDPILLIGARKKKPTILKSSIEANHRVVAYAVAETIWIRKLLFDLGIVLTSPVKVYCNNLSATYLTANPVHHDRSKHSRH